MRPFVRGIFVGVGMGMLVAAVKGEEMRGLLAERAAELGGYLPENEQLNQYVKQMTDRVSQTTGNLKDYAQQAASKMKETGSALGDIAQRTTTDVKQTGQDTADTTKQQAQTIKQTS